ncbi:VanZ family protein [Haliea sp.]|uniref:VanZ family protein n=1 Tax=Haliea TaxID=475794 RepID=UPI000C62E7F3|nr:VanZ family protein [Haliea sp.]MAD62020.1 heparinase [Haliea sp.]MAY93977.1 heparinase [Haliea sp.]MBK41736.1 heparinase [Haliea sp.]MBP70548.1 heparinase [Haliea sp.]
MIAPTRSHFPWLWLGYSLLLVYGTWFPLDRWDWALGGWQAFMAMDWPQRVARSDFILNLIVYLPYGLLAMLCLRGTLIRRLLLATVSAAALSASLEFGQTYLPGRVSSLADLLLNSAGGFLGALGAGLAARLPLSRHLRQQVLAMLRDPTTGRLGLLALGCWLLAQWAPLVPSLDIGNLRAGLAPLKATVLGETPLLGAKVISYILMLFAVGTLLLSILSPGPRRLVSVFGLLFAVLLGKVLVLGRVLSAEALLAFACLMPVFWLLRNVSPRYLRWALLLSLLAYQIHDALLPGSVDTALRTVNWIPFRGHINSVHGVVNLLETVWVFIALAWVTYPWSRSRVARALLAFTVAMGTLGLEWWQQFVPGRYPDLTDALVATGGWWLASVWRWGHYSGDADKHATRATLSGVRPGRGARTRRPLSGKRTRLLLGTAAVGSVLVLVALYVLLARDERPPYALPSIDTLPTPTFPDWRQQHPRLPAPAAEDIALLRAHNPGFWDQHRKRAAKGALYSRILLARVEPGSQDLQALHSDLMALEPEWRGHEQTKPLALAYDWLHALWTPAQRHSLLTKVEAACAYQVHVITDKYALSPYNVYLYNSPLQALMMAAIASHGDSANDSCMRFTADYWRYRVLPVWRQVMGTTGGWHEGGEYVGIGIGQAIYQLPALWRTATGEDLFASEPGIRGFADFALHRMRPDRTYIRSGDAAYFRRRIPDLAPLALETGHRPAYSLAAPPQQTVPLGWPWGPLSQASFANDTALQREPTSRWFDGIGLLLARSSWQADATFVTFRAGNNFWSHSHLDQGAFTIFRSGPLALDSGLYNRYGSEHHLNYSYQSIAHNVVTVTDPADDAPMPSKTEGEPSRVIANDGGQRRVGSGWGRAAPLDYLHWQQQEEHYRTVGEVRHGDTDGVSWVVADLTPAYTNAASGTGDFSARNKRIRHYQRSFVFDRRAQVIVVHDRVTTEDATFRQKWLLHSELQPELQGPYFRIAAPHTASGPRGVLKGQVLLPEDASLTAIGGPGFEYFVDEKNYDEDGAVQAVAQRKREERGAEPGAWRLELQPGRQAEAQEFLVVMRTGEWSATESITPAPAAMLKTTGDTLTLTLNGDQPLTLHLPRNMGDIQLQRGR